MVLFLGMAFLSLLIEFWKDVHTLKVDERRAWFMQGAGIALALSVGNAWAYIIATLLVVIVSGWIAKKELKAKKVIFADGDRDILRWLVPGCFALYPLFAVYFLVLLIPSLISLHGLRHYTKTRAAPGLIAILAAFIMTGTLAAKGLLII